MSDSVGELALWLADVHLLAGALLAVALLAAFLLRQPAQRMALEKSTLAGLLALVVLCALPGWSLVHLLSEEAPIELARVSIAAAPAERTPNPIEAPLLPATEYVTTPSMAAPAIAVPNSTHINWVAVALLVQGIGSVAVVAWLGLGAIAARRVRRASRPASPELAEALRTIVGEASVPELLTSAAIATPVAIGLRRPAIILPDSLVRSGGLVGGQVDASPSDVDRGATPGRSPGLSAVLAHEYAHILGGDLRTLAASRWLLAVLWPQPLFWLLRRVIRLDQETLADAAAAEVAGRVDYAEQLLAWARIGGPRGRAPRLAGAVGLWEGPSQLKRRIATLLDEKLTVLRHASRRWRIGTACAALFAAGLLSLVTLQRREAAAQESDALAAEAGPAATRQSDEPATASDADAPGAEPEAASLFASDPMVQLTGVRARDDAAPNMFTGRCVDEYGKPLAGVKLTLVSGMYWNSAPQQLGEAETGADGKFRFGPIVDLATTYPDGVIPEQEPDREPRIACVARLAGRATCDFGVLQSWLAQRGYAVDVVMRPAAVLRGRVTNAEGEPIEGAKVAPSGPMASVGGAREATTDANGEYVLDDLAPFDFEAEARRRAEEAKARDAAVGSGDKFLSYSAAPTFTVTHPDYGFERIHTASLPGVANAVLKRGGAISGRVVLPDGKPAAGIAVRLGASVPRQANDYNVPMFDFSKVSPDDMYATSTTTDAEGRFRITGLRPLKFDVWAETPGWFAKGRGDVAVEASKTTGVDDLLLSHGGTIRVTFVDAATRKPIRGEGGLQAQLGMMHDDKLSRENEPAVVVTVGEDGVATLPVRAGRGRLITQAATLNAGGEPQWRIVDAGNYMKCPVVDVVDGASVAATLQVRRVAADALGVAAPPAVFQATGDTGFLNSLSATGNAAGRTMATNGGQVDQQPFMYPMDGAIDTFHPDSDSVWRLVGSDGDAISGTTMSSAAVGSGGGASSFTAASPLVATGTFVAFEIAADSEAASPDTTTAEGVAEAATEAGVGGASSAAAEPEATHSVVGGGTFHAIKVDELFGTGPDANKIAVRCLDAAGKPLAGVSAALYRTQLQAGKHELVAEATTNATGDLEIAAPVPAEKLARYQELSAAKAFDAEMYATSYILALRGANVATALLFTQEYGVALRGYRTEVKLRAPQKLSGRVTNAAGKPVAGALVAAGSFASNLMIEGVNAVRTDAEGRYEFTDRQPLDAKAAQELQQKTNNFLVAANGVARPELERPEVGVDWEASNLVVTHPDYALTTQQGGDIPGTVDVTMLPAAAIAGRVVQFGTGAPVAGVLVRVMRRPEPVQLPAGSVVMKPAEGPTAWTRSHAASTRTDAEGRYQLGNLPEGKYDVWVDPYVDNPRETTLNNRGISQLVVHAGEAPTAADDLVVGPGVHVRVQLVNAKTGEPLRLAEEGWVTVAPMYADGAQLQYRSPPREAVSTDGTFEFHMAPGRVRLSLFVFTRGEGDGQPDYTTSDDSFTEGAPLEGAHGSEVSLTVPTWPRADLEKIRELSQRASTLHYEKKWTEAIAAASEALEQYPASLAALLARAGSYEQLKQYDKAIADYESVLTRRPDDGNALFRLAAILASADDAKVRDGKRAVQVATELVAAFRAQGDESGVPFAIDILAAAYAEAGDFEKAVATEREALVNAPAEKLAKFEERLKLYEAGKPYHRE